MSSNKCDAFAVSQAMEAKHAVTCRRVAADPFSDKNTDRLGIKLGTCYQV